MLPKIANERTTRIPVARGHSVSGIFYMVFVYPRMS